MTLKTINFRNKMNKNTGQEREVKIIIILLSVFISSIIFGIGLTNGNLHLFIKIYNNFYDNNFSMTSFFINSLLSNLILLSLVFISGFSSIGIPAIFVSIVLKGFSVGCLCTVLITEYSLTGIVIYLLTVFPSDIIFCQALILASSYSFLQSTEILALIYEKGQNEKIIIHRYLYKFIILLIFIISASFLDALLMVFFMKYI